MNDDEARAHAAKMAQRYENDLLESPEYRGEDLFEATSWWRVAEEYDRSIELLQRHIDDPGENGRIAGKALVELADVMFERSREAEARDYLDQLRHLAPVDFRPYYEAAELLDVIGRRLNNPEDLQLGLHFANMAADHLSPIERAQIHGPAASFSDAGAILDVRRRLRRQLKLPDDKLDDLAETAKMATIELVEEQAAKRQAAAPTARIQRNAPCPCGSGTKHKKCCGRPQPT